VLLHTHNDFSVFGATESKRASKLETQQGQLANQASKPLSNYRFGYVLALLGSWPA